jgi:tRNA-2-methylthio-N6-dimethylallyladenosine synthase
MPGRYYVQTFGCQMNVHDSDRMSEVLRAHGWSEADEAADADLIIFNTCSVREKAEQKLRIEVDRLAPLKRARPELVVAVAGCVAQQEGERILEAMPDIDIVIGPDNIPELPELVQEQMAGALPAARTVFDLEAPRFLAAQPEPGKAPATAFVTTMKGCDERCSFCIVPYTRGPERYRPAREIVAEIGRWVDAGAREVMLLGQTVDSYRDATLPPPARDDPDESQFPALLRLIAREVPGLARLRYVSPHPRHATPALVAAHAELEVLARHIHFPAQSGSDRILRRMIRRYTRAEYIARAERLLGARPGMTMSTDLIVGFPGETEEDFEATLSLVRAVGFTSVYAYKYSPRPFTPALKLRGDVPERRKSARLTRLLELVDAQGAAHLSRLVGTRQRVLFEGLSKKSGQRERQGATVSYRGRSEQNEIVHVEVPEGVSLANEILDVTIVKANKHSLEGELVGEAKVRYETFAEKSPARPARRALPVVGAG